MKVEEGWLVLLLATLACLLTHGDQRPPCAVKVGVVDVGDWLDHVNNAWYYLANQPHHDDVTMTFRPMSPRRQETIKVLIDAYMDLGSKNISAIIGPYLPVAAIAARKFHIPYLVTDWDIQPQVLPDDVIVTLPLPGQFAQALVDLVKAYQWRQMALMYDNDQGSVFVSQLAQITTLHVRAWSLEDNRSFKEILLEMRQLSITCIMVVTGPKTASDIISQALQLSMLSDKYAWIIPGLNQSELLDLDGYLYTGFNLTLLTLVTPQFIKVTRVLKTKGSTLDLAIAHDALLTLYHGVALNYKLKGTCSWKEAPVITDTLQKIQVQGATGHLAFTEQLRRKTYSAEILSLIDGKITNIGNWTSAPDQGQPNLVLAQSKVLNYTSRARLNPDHVKVVTILEAPFVKLKHDAQLHKGNERFEGYCIELLERLASDLKFEYEIYLVEDEQFGARRDDGTWSGMVGEIIAGNASLALGPLMISAQRERVIDFTKPFMSLGISLVMQRPAENSPMFHFTEPLSTVIWILLVAVLVTISFSLFLVERVEVAREDRSPLSAPDTSWFTFMTLVRANSEVIPRTLAGRILSGSLSLFALIIISFYTANLAAFLTVSKLQTPITSVSDLPKQNRIKYGTVRHSEVSQYFQNNNMNIFQQMWTYMSAVEPTNLVATSEEGFQKVLNSNGAYAFIWDSPVVKYRVGLDCDLVQVGQPFASKSYGIGVPLGAAYRDLLTMEILKMGEEGFLEFLRSKWWSQSKCPGSDERVSTSRELSLKKVKGIFLVLGVGLVLALLVAAAEALVRRRCKKTKNRDKLVRRDASPSSKPLCDGDSGVTLRLQPVKVNSCHKHDNHTGHMDVNIDHVKMDTYCDQPENAYCDQPETAYCDQPENAYRDKPETVKATDIF